MSTESVEQKATEGAFERFADRLTTAIGAPAAFLAGVVIVLLWAVSGPFAGFSNTWQLVINSFTTITTFLMVFLLGNASNRITENQDTMLERIYTEEERISSNEKLIEELVERIDEEHIQPLMERLEAIAAAVRAEGRA